MRSTAALVIAVSLGLVSGQTCPTSYVSVGGECLAFLSGTGTWYEQLNLCSMVTNSGLAKITGDLHNAVYQYITDYPDLMDKCFWIGGSDRVQEAHWLWENDQTEIPLGAPHWDPCEVEPDGGTAENFLAICPDMYYYKDYPSGHKHHAICQIF